MVRGSDVVLARWFLRKNMEGLAVSTVLEKLPEHAVCTLSLLEIVDEEVLRDLLAADPVESQSKLEIRHPDGKGAVVQNLSDVPLDSLTGLDVSMLHCVTSFFVGNASVSFVTNLSLITNSLSQCCRVFAALDAKRLLFQCCTESEEA